MAGKNPGPRVRGARDVMCIVEDILPSGESVASEPVCLSLFTILCRLCRDSISI